MACPVKLEDLTLAQLREISRQMEIRNISKLTPEFLCQQIKHIFKAQPSCTEKLFAFPTVIFKKDMQLFRVRDWNQCKPVKDNVLFLSPDGDKSIIELLRQYRVSFAENQEKAKDKWKKNLYLDIFTVKEDLELILLTKDWNYNQLEKEIKNQDKDYEKGMDELPDNRWEGSNFPAANWLKENTCVKGWLDTIENTEFIEEVMLTPKGIQSLHNRKTMLVDDYLKQQ